MLATLALLTLQTTVAFSYDSATAQSVSIAGDAFGWGTPKKLERKGDVWSTTLSVPDDARLEYKFVVDGNWILDPKNEKRIDNGIGGENSFWEGPTYRLNTLEEPPKTPLERTTFNAMNRVVTIFAPKSSKGLPILLYGDGPNYERYAKVQNVVQNLVEAGRIRPVVIVLVPPTDRMREYGARWKEYGAYLFNVVLPRVRKATGASEKPSDVYLGGSSMGGLISLRLAEEFHDQCSGGVHSQSGAFQAGFAGGSTVTEPSLKKLNPRTKLWLCWGTYEQELTESNVKATATLKKMGRRFGSKVTNEGHTWTSWRNRMVDGLVYLLGK